MSPRTKLLILAIFLVLLAIPAAYVALIWSPGNPLRFRVVKTQGTPKHNVGHYPQFQVAMENTSAATIYVLRSTVVDLDTPELSKRDLGSIWSMDDTKVQRTGTTYDYMSIIPPHSSVDASCWMNLDRVEDAKAGRLRVEYTCISSIKNDTDETILWLQQHCPKAVQPFLPPKSDYTISITPLHPLENE